MKALNASRWSLLLALLLFWPRSGEAGKRREARLDAAAQAAAEAAAAEAQAAAEAHAAAAEQPAPEGFTPLQVVGVLPAAGGATVLLADEQETLVVPIGVGASEALSNALRSERRRYERPLTHDLLDSVVRELSGEIAQVRVDDLRSGVFVATLSLQQGERTTRLDCRSSDAIALALGNQLPIWFADQVLQAAGIPWEEFMTPMDAPMEEDPALDGAQTDSL